MLHGRINSMASLTILPTFYSATLNLDPFYVRKIIYSVIFALVPLTLFQFWQKNTATPKLFSRYSYICFVIFSIALVISHYALAEVFLALLVITAALTLLLKKRSTGKITMIAFFLVIMFAWYVYTSNATVFESTLSFGNNLIAQLNEFFNISARESTVLRALGLEQPETIWNLLSRIFVYLTELFILLGFIGLITKRTEIKLETTYYILTVVAMIFLALVIVLPGMSKTLNMTRFYHVLLFLIAPLCVLGTEFLTRITFKPYKQQIASTILLIVLVPYFLFQTGFVYELTETQSWAPLTLHRMDYYRLYFWSGYVDDQSVYSIQWISQNVNFKQTRIFADLSSVRNMLRTYGLIYDGYISYLYNTTRLSQGELVYLNPLNCIYNTVVTEYYNYSTNELNFLETMNKVYTNGGAEVYKTAP